MSNGIIIPPIPWDLLFRRMIYLRDEGTTLGLVRSLNFTSDELTATYQDEHRGIVVLDEDQIPQPDEGFSVEVTASNSSITWSSMTGTAYTVDASDGWTINLTSSDGHFSWDGDKLYCYISGGFQPYWVMQVNCTFTDAELCAGAVRAGKHYGYGDIIFFHENGVAYYSPYPLNYYGHVVERAGCSTHEPDTEDGLNSSWTERMLIWTSLPVYPKYTKIRFRPYSAVNVTPIISITTSLVNIPYFLYNSDL
jgi:hypothetical protein